MVGWSSDGAAAIVGTGRPLTIAATRDEQGAARWEARTQLHTTEHGASQETTTGTATAEIERIEPGRWDEQDFIQQVPGQVTVDSAWRSASYCVEINGQRACVKVTALALDHALANRLGVTMP